ncbi:MAG TPA: efflux RND transporter periplasmic adaptor subunit [Puia sp.]|jgi:membrane fusion protein (multidrug efflux system)|nr:efflux RND transporter periplasmic adaptor subunit [Puia sp.]
MKRYSFFAIPLLLSLLAASCGSDPAPSIGQGTDSTVVQTFPLTKGRLTTHLELPGELRPFQEVDLYAKVNSFVRHMFVDVGSKVHKGELLATLQAPELEDALNAASALLQTQQALYRASRATYDRMYRTSKIPGTISPNELDIAYAKMGADSANLAAARSRYQEAAVLQGYLEVRAPFDGVVSSRTMYDGAYAGPAGKGSSIPLMTIQEQAKLRLVIAVPEAATSYFRQKDTVHFTVQTLPGQAFTASISRLAGSLDMQLRTEQLEMDVYNKDNTLLPGMFAQVALDLTNEKKVFIVPKAAVTGNSRQIFVISIVNGRAEWIPVQKGRENGDKVEIFGNLKEGSQLVAAATDELKKGTPVQVKSI